MKLFDTLMVHSLERFLLRKKKRDKEKAYKITVNFEIFTRILFSQIKLKDIHVFATLKICDLGYDLPISVTNRAIF